MKPTSGIMGFLSSGITQEDRSNSMNSSAFSTEAAVWAATAATEYPARASRNPTELPTLPAPMMATVFMMCVNRDE